MVAYNFSLLQLLFLYRYIIPGIMKGQEKFYILFNIMNYIFRSTYLLYLSGTKIGTVHLDFTMHLYFGYLWSLLVQALGVAYLMQLLEVLAWWQLTGHHIACKWLKKRNLCDRSLIKNVLQNKDYEYNIIRSLLQKKICQFILY